MKAFSVVCCIWKLYFLFFSAPSFLHFLLSLLFEPSVDLVIMINKYALITEMENMEMVAANLTADMILLALFLSIKVIT